MSKVGEIRMKENKYKEALDAAQDVFEYNNLHGLPTLAPDQFNLLKKLVDKETPMKPVYRIPDISWNKNEKLAHCPTCDWLLDWKQGCQNNNCRQRIDWSKDNE